MDSNKTYVGIVEDNLDPKKLGRVKARVMDVFDNIPIEDIPWAQPWKDLNGNSFNVPEKGKVVMVVFDQGDKNRPEFIYSDHYNINLEKKLESLSSGNYPSMKSLIFDHKTQIFVNDDEGLVIDHKYNNVNITENTIDLNLKDNNRSVNIGDSTAGQQAILGNHWMDWFDEFVDNLLGQNAGPFLGNLGAPVIANPALISCLLKYKSLRDPVFLSHHVNLVDNNKVKTVGMTDRQDDPQLGDSWTSTKHENTLTEKTDDNFKPVEGPKQQFDESKVSATSSVAGVTASLSSQTSNPLIDKLIKYLNSKGYKVYEDINVLNLVSMRTKDDGVITNKFDDILYVFYRNKNGNWEIIDYSITTTPGFTPNTTELPQDSKVIAFGQFIDQCKIDYYQNEKCLKFSEVSVYINDRVDKYNYKSPIKTGSFGVTIHQANSIGNVETVYNYSDDGSQVFKSPNQYKQFITLCEAQESIKNTFTYTICRKSEFDDFVPVTPKVKSEVATKSNTIKKMSGDEKLDLVINRIGNTQVQKDASGNRSAIVFYNDNKNYIVFYNNSRFSIFDNPSQGWISKGSYDDGGRKLVVTDGLKSGKTFNGATFWDAIALYKK
jgi:hypothetical protein